MDKLTIEQRDWLIEKVKLIKTGELFNPNNVAQVYILKALTSVENIINQCTEQAFPKYKLTALNLDDVESTLEIFECCDKHIYLDLNDESICIRNDDFKKFVEAINKMAEYLDAKIE